MNRAILWFRNDLRLSDHLPLQAVLAEVVDLVPVYVLDDRFLEADEWGFQRTGPYRMQFILECLTDLREHLRELGSDLLFYRGRPEEILPQVAEQYQCEGVYASRTYTRDELEVEERLATKMDLRLYHDSPMVHPDDVPFAIDRMPEVFTAFRKKVEKYSHVREAIPSPKAIPSPALEAAPLPTLTDLGYPASAADQRGVLPFKGGALAAWERVEHYFWNTEQLSVYKETRNGLIGADYSSKFSPWLAQGCISARAIFHEVEKYQQEVTKNQSTYWLQFELLWRDFFKYTAMRYGRRIFWPNGIKDQRRKWGYRPQVMQRWIDGETGDDFVDANMRELRQTGFMSNRGRQNVASYLVHKLNLDWRAGAAWFESLLIDYDVTSNYGNWISAAGVGNDPRDRIFNTKRQADMYDKKGAYRDLWLRQSVDSQ